MNSDRISVNSGDIGDLMTDLSTLEGDITALQGSLATATGGFKDGVTSSSIAGSNPGTEHYTDAASVIFGAAPMELPQLKSLKCWGDSMGVIGYELEYMDGVIYKRVGTAALPSSPETLDFATGQYVSKIDGGVGEDVKSLTFTRNDGM